MRKIITLSLIVIFFGLSMSNVNAQATKRVLLEQHTGAWCGWCPDGTVIMDNLMEDYPNEVIGVKWHNGDAMANTQQSQLAQSLGLGGYPNGSVDRAAFNDGQGGVIIMMGRGGWKQASEVLMEQTPEVEVFIEDWSYNQSSKEVTVTLKVNVLKDIPRQIAFDAILCENNVSGPNNSAWNQRNYLSGRPGFENNPYYNEPDPIVGYVHNKVARMNFAADIFGETGTVPASVMAGQSFTHTLTKKLPTVQGDPINMDNAFIVGFVANRVLEGQATVQILNAVTNEVNMGKVAVNLKSGKSYAIVEPASSHQFTFTVQNVYDEARDFDLSAIDVPEDWNVSLSKTKINLLANASTDITATVTAPDMASSADINIYTVASSESSVNSTNKVRVITDNIKNMVIDYTGTTDFAGYVESTQFSDYDPFVSVYFNEYQEGFDKFQDIEVIVWSGGDGLPLNQSAIGLIDFAFSSGVKTIISGDVPLFDNNATNLRAKLGIANHHYRGHAEGTYSVTGVDGDPVTDNWEATSSIARYFYSGFLSTKDETVPMIKYQNEADTLAAVRTIYNGTKAIVIGFSPANINEIDARITLINNAIDWLLAEPGDGGLIVSDVSEIDFGTTDAPVTKYAVISNEGDETLTISNVTIDGDEEFTVNSDMNISIAPGEELSIEVVYTPITEGINTADLVIKSNATNEAELRIPLTGNSTTSVIDGIAGKEGVFTMSVGPNPMSDAANLTYNVNSNDIVNVKIDMIDAAGNVVMNIVNTQKVAGEYQVQIKSNELSSGTYYLISNSNGVKAQLPLVIVK